MTDNERSKLCMYESLITFLSENRDITITVRGFSQTVVKLRKMLDDIKIKEKVLSSDILEKTIATSQVKDELIFSLVPVTAALFTYAKLTNNLPLKEKTRHGQSYFYRIMDRELIDNAMVICLLAEHNLTHLKKFGVNSTHTKALKSQINRYVLSLDNKITSLISSNVVMTISGLFNEADNICSIMDGFVEQLDDNFVEFYDEYMLVRTLEYHDKKNELMDEEEIEEIEE